MIVKVDESLYGNVNSSGETEMWPSALYSSKLHSSAKVNPLCFQAFTTVVWGPAVLK